MNRDDLNLTTGLLAENIAKLNRISKQVEHKRIYYSNGEPLYLAIQDVISDLGIIKDKLKEV